MKTKTILLSVASVFMALSCSKQQGEPEATACGKMMLDLSPSVEFVTGTRSVDESTYSDVNSYQVVIEDINGASKFNDTYAVLLSKCPLELNIGSYTIRAWKGNESAASRTDFKVAGENTFTIKADATVTTSVACKPTCGKVSVVWGSTMSSYYSAYSVDISGSAALASDKVTFDTTQADPCYFLISDTGETLSYCINLTANKSYVTKLPDGTTQANAQVSGTFNITRGKAYTLRINPAYTQTADGGLSVTITIDDSTNDKQVDITVPISWI